MSIDSQQNQVSPDRTRKNPASQIEAPAFPLKTSKRLTQPLHKSRVICCSGKKQGLDHQNRRWQPCLHREGRGTCVQDCNGIVKGHKTKHDQNIGDCEERRFPDYVSE